MVPRQIDILAVRNDLENVLTKGNDEEMKIPGTWQYSLVPKLVNTVNASSTCTNKLGSRERGHFPVDNGSHSPWDEEISHSHDHTIGVVRSCWKQPTA